MPEPAPLSYGQLSVWRDVRGLDRGRWQEANTRTVWLLDDAAPYDAAEVRAAVLALAERHESLRTAYDLADPLAPAQRVLERAPAPDAAVVACEPDGFDPLVDALAAEPFDLRTGRSWRARVVTAGGRPRAVVLVQHHITADGWSNGVLEADFRAALGPGLGTAPEVTPRRLAEWQRSDGRRNRRDALLGYWERIFDLSPARLPMDEPDTAVQYSVRSHRAHAGARALAERLSVPLSSVVLAAFAWSVARAAAPGALVAQLMSSNRFVPPWNTVVSSMNQWTAASLTLAPEEFAPFVAHVHTRSLLAYRHGMYDVDEVDALRDRVRAGREPYQASCGYNFLTGGRPPADAADREEALVPEVPFSRIGHPCYLRATEEAGGSLELRLRTMGATDLLTRDVLAATVARLTDPAS
ncbi:condensation domain-containing protein [Kitasatospora cinereorecta]|uniref:Condensation domain-containing protein n=1 Tax=Kitasatospora cinereorecta TaxID=285560 RepID=A0ABW0V3F3_9ACTN